MKPVAHAVVHITRAGSDVHYPSLPFVVNITTCCVMFTTMSQISLLSFYCVVIHNFISLQETLTRWCGLPQLYSSPGSRQGHPPPPPPPPPLSKCVAPPHKFLPPPLSVPPLGKISAYNPAREILEHYAPSQWLFWNNA